MAALLFGGAALLATLGFADLIRARRSLAITQDRWRDPAPVIFRLLLPLARLIASWCGSIPSWIDQPMRRTLERSGMGYVILSKELLALRGITAIIGLGIGSAITAVLDLTRGNQFLVIAIASILGLSYPVIWLRDHGNRRLKQIEREFPALLELLALSVQAGLSFSAALEQCIGQLQKGPLADEFHRAAREIRTGSSRQQALQRLATRLELPAVNAFVSAVIQADETGAPISKTLNDQATQRRRDRFALAEKKANEAPVKMLLPLVALLFPLTFLIIAFPIALQFMDGGLL